MMRFRKSSSKWMQAVVACILATQIGWLPVAQAASGPTDNSTLQSARGGAPQSAPNPGNVGGGSFTGGASYAVPIRVAPGVGGVQPNLSLGYSSHSAQKGSWVGAGWSLSLGSVSRSLQYGLPTYDNVKDTFVYNGENLDNTFSNLGGRWYTQRESFLDIETVPAGSAASTNINAWEVRSKSGTTSRFGQRNGATAEDCVIRNPNQINKIFSWLLCEVEDVHGNLMRVYYDRSDAGNAHPDRIEYGTGADLNRRVVFNLEGRSDQSEAYIAGFLQKMTLRLDDIEVEAIKPGTSTWELIRRYDLIYGAPSFDSGRSLLREAREYGADNGAVTAPLKTAFSYRSNYGPAGAPLNTGWSLATAGEFDWGPSMSLVDTENGDTGVRLGDVDGDGLPDLVKVFADPATINFDQPFASTATMTADSGVYLNTGSGFSSNVSGAWPIPTGSFWAPYLAMRVDGETWSTGRSLLDITGDGRVDFVGGTLNLNNRFRATPWWPQREYWNGGEMYDLFFWPWHTSSESGWRWSDPYGSTRGDSYPMPDPGSDDYLVPTLAEIGVSLEGEPKMITLSGNTRFADLQGDGLPDMIVRGARARYAVDCAYVLGGCFPQSYICFNEEEQQEPALRQLRLGFGASYVIYNTGADTSGDVRFDYPALTTTPGVEIENFNTTWPGGNCHFKFFSSTDYQPCDPTDIACHPYLLSLIHI